MAHIDVQYSKHNQIDPRLSLMWNIAFRFHLCNFVEDLLPPKEKKIERKWRRGGWQVISLGSYSAWENKKIKEWVSTHPDKAQISKHERCEDMLPCVGLVTKKARLLGVCPSVYEEAMAFLQTLKYLRPCTIVTKKITPEIEKLLPKNHLIVSGENFEYHDVSVDRGSAAISFELVSRETYEEIIRLSDKW